MPGSDPGMAGGVAGTAGIGGIVQPFGNLLLMPIGSGPRPDDAGQGQSGHHHPLP